ncbi:Transcription factor eupR [Paramyrothecium foliicola]|nr:Transcription factor eupR [Paramyrothecium foliicola]
MSTADGSVARRKVRKGTSCWECKRRKTRCEFRPASSACASCQRRDLPCISQEVNDEDAVREPVERRVLQIEDMVDRLLQQKRGADRTPLSTSLCPAPASLLLGASLNSLLRTMLPLPSTAAIILERGNFGGLPTRISKLGSSHRIPGQFVRAASHHVTSHDDLVNSLDGLEVLMLEASYYISNGDVRVAWLTMRRAIAVAQLLGADAQQSLERARMLWFGLLSGDRWLSLTLGLSAATADNGFLAPLCPDTMDDEETDGIDGILKSLARSMPSRWLFKSLGGMQGVASFTSRISFWRFAPPLSMLESRTLGRYPSSRPGSPRKAHHGPSYRGVDDKVVPAVAALLLAHVDGHRLGHLYALDHQRAQDMGVAQELVATFEGSRGANDAEVVNLKSLVDIEAETAGGVNFHLGMGAADAVTSCVNVLCLGPFGQLGSTHRHRYYRITKMKGLACFSAMLPATHFYSKTTFDLGSRVD